MNDPCHLQVPNPSLFAVAPARDETVVRKSKQVDERAVALIRLLRTVGLKHPLALAERRRLAEALLCEEQNPTLAVKAEAAELHFRAGLRDSRLMLGAEHPETLAFMLGLASALKINGSMNEAESLRRAVLATREQRLGPDHPDTCAIHRIFAFDFLAQKRHSEAVALLRRVLGGFERHFGPDHPEACDARETLARTLIKQGHHPEAFALYRRILADSERLSGPNSWETAGIADEFASELHQFGEAELESGHPRVAVAHFQEAFAVMQRDFDKEQLESEYYQHFAFAATLIRQSLEKLQADDPPH